VDAPLSTPAEPKAASVFRSEHAPGLGITPGRAAVTCKRVSRMREAADFERVLAQPARVANRHFALHGLESEPRARSVRRVEPAKTSLSTDEETVVTVSVDNVSSQGQLAVAPRCIWLGIVVPKRYARRAVTRSLLKRQIRCGVERLVHCIPHGMWVFRLRSSFDPLQFVTAAPKELRLTVRREVDQLLEALKASKLGHRLSLPLP
jgi:ribonuclease P protein component